MRIDSKTLTTIENEFGEFDISQVTGGSYDIYLRFGYWSEVDAAKLQELLGNTIHVQEITDWDDDCGTLYSYTLQAI